MIWDGDLLDWRIDPVEALRRWPADRRVVMLHSGRFQREWSRYTILAEPVGAYRFEADRLGKGRSVWVGAERACPVGRFCDRLFDDLRALLGGSAHSDLWIGYLSYDLARWIERLPEFAVDDRGWPVVELGYCPGYLVHDGVDGSWRVCGSWRDRGRIPLQFSKGKIERGELIEDGRGGFCVTGRRGVFTLDEYLTKVGIVKEYISAGDVFQVNFAQRFTADFEGAYPAAPRALYWRLAGQSPAWYGAYLEMGDEQLRRTIVSGSPELFLKLDRDGHVVTRPIKGTRAGGKDVGELLKSQKDQAELHMIVDLMRNDLGKVCEYGSVRVVESRAIETHPTVHHGVATVEGRMYREKDVVDLLRAAFPAGSVTGVPKVRAMEIIDELEPVRRGPYCGAIGYLSRERACLSVGIRTMLIEQESEVGGSEESASGRIDYSVGGGIIADSNPIEEYRETLVKARAMVEALGRSTGAVGMV